MQPTLCPVVRHEDGKASLSMAAKHLVFVLPNNAERDRWVPGALARQFTIVRDVDVLEATLRSAVVEGGGDTVRVVVDGGAMLDQFLVLVSTAPRTFIGEMLFISRDGSGYLSTRDIDVKRTVRAIAAAEVEVYLRWLGLPARPRASYSGVPPRTEQPEVSSPLLRKQST